MDSIILIMAGVYFLMVGIQGNALNFFAAITGERTFLYWVVAVLVVTALWETDTGSEVAKPLAALIVLSFLLSQNSSAGERNYALIGSGLKQVLPAL